MRATKTQWNKLDVSQWTLATIFTCWNEPTSPHFEQMRTLGGRGEGANMEQLHIHPNIQWWMESISQSRRPWRKAGFDTFAILHRRIPLSSSIIPLSSVLIPPDRIKPLCVLHLHLLPLSCPHAAHRVLCTLHTAPSTLHTAHCTLSSILYIVHCKLHTVHCTVHTAY